MTTIKLFLRESKKNSKGESPVSFRIIKNRKSIVISTGIWLLPAQWDKDNLRVFTKVKNSERLNQMIDHRQTELRDNSIEQDTFNKNASTRQIKNAVMGYQPVDFFSYADKACEEYRRAGQIGSYDKNRAIIEKLRVFTKYQNIYFQDIDIEFLKRYEIHCQEKLFNKVNTIHMNMKFIRKLFNDAYAQDLIQHKDIPFNKYKLKTEKTHREYLTEDELEKFEKAEVTPGTRMDLHKDMFVFSAYAGGLRVSDVLQLTWDNYDGENIHVAVKKTKAQLSFMLPDRAKEIVAKYRPADPNPTDFIFPMLPADMKRDDPYEVDLEISRATAYINKNVDLIAKKAKLTKHVSFHISRHTWATRALTKGISIDKVSKILGHADISETQIYAKIINEELNKAMQVFNIKKPEPKPKTVKAKTTSKPKATKAKTKPKPKAAITKTKRQPPAPDIN